MDIAVMDDRQRKKERMSVTLSPRTMEMITELRESTDADSDSEVIRNSIRLAYAIMSANQSGSSLVLENREGVKTPILFGGIVAA